MYLRALFLIALLVIIIICFAIYHPSAEAAVMFQPCTLANRCGGGLICDQGRCRQPLGGPCAVDGDCIAGLGCHNWTCQKRDDKHTPCQASPQHKRSIRRVRFRD